MRRRYKIEKMKDSMNSVFYFTVEIKTSLFCCPISF